MPGASFLDTNVLVYFAIQGSPRSHRAAELVETGGTINVQVLNEFTNVARGKMRMTWEETIETLQFLRELLEVEPLTVEVHERALMLAERHNFQIYDAMIVAAAIEAGCSTLYSEDMHHGLLLEGRLRIVNPFT
ncbi:MAG: PIN domain-containing protein [Burkholderiales bacterium]|nr:MAG: PIN domain-containing protein [Burkholderiales bacterium]